MKTKAELIMIIKLVRKYCYRKMVSSTMLSPDGIRSLGSCVSPYKWNNHGSMRKKIDKIGKGVEA